MIYRLNLLYIKFYCKLLCRFFCLLRNMKRRWPSLRTLALTRAVHYSRFTRSRSSNKNKCSIFIVFLSYQLKLVFIQFLACSQAIYTMLKTKTRETIKMHAFGLNWKRKRWKGKLRVDRRQKLLQLKGVGGWIIYFYNPICKVFCYISFSFEAFCFSFSLSWPKFHFLLRSLRDFRVCFIFQNTFFCNIFTEHCVLERILRSSYRTWR